MGTESDISEIALFLSQDLRDEDNVGEAPCSTDSFSFDEDASSSSPTESFDGDLCLSMASRLPTQLVTLQKEDSPAEDPLAEDSVAASEIATTIRPRGIVSL